MRWLPAQSLHRGLPILAIAASILLLPRCGNLRRHAVDLSPRAWPAEAARLASRPMSFSRNAGEVSGHEMMILGTTGGPAVRAGWEALLQGGSAVDAALATALTQIALAGGSWVSYAGLFTMVVYDAKTGEVHSLSAGFGIPRGETDPLSIPAKASGHPSGRTALVPGFMAGVGAAHGRFGRLPLATLLGPAIYYAEEGFELSPTLAGMIASRREVLARLPETRAIFFGEDGKPHPAGHRFRQPELARTLRAVAMHGVRYMYDGPWAKHFVEVVNREGGLFAAEDLNSYEAVWGQPYRTEYQGFEIAAVGPPTMGGLNAVECLNLVERAGLGPCTESAESLFWWIQITNAYVLSFVAPQARFFVLPGAEADPEHRATKEWADELWERMQEGTFLLTRTPNPGTHSDAVVAMDAEGNVAALVHSINTSLWGETGIFVDGVSIPDAASYQQEMIATAGPGAHLPDPTNPLIVLRDGQPVLASGSIGGGLHQKTMLCLYRVLGGMAPATAIEAPSLLLPKYGAMGRSTAQVPAGAFREDLLRGVRELGQPILVMPPEEQGALRGYWIGILRDPATGDLTGGFPAGLGGGGFGR